MRHSLPGSLRAEFTPSTTLALWLPLQFRELCMRERHLRLDSEMIAVSCLHEGGNEWRLHTLLQAAVVSCSARQKKDRSLSGSQRWQNHFFLLIITVKPASSSSRYFRFFHGVKEYSRKLLRIIRTKVLLYSLVVLTSTKQFLRFSDAVFGLRP